MERELSAEGITRNLKTRLIGQRVLYYPQLPSTMDTARKEAQSGAPEGMVIAAGEQTAGRGRIKRGWISPRGSVSLSLILYPELSYLPSIVMIASLAVLHSIEKTTGLAAALKWPNDVLVQGKKVCGILIETDIRGGKVNYAITGIGINVNFKVADFPEIPDTATSLATELNREVPELDIILCLLRHFERLYLRLPDAEDIFQEWRQHLTTLGQRVKVTSGSSTITGTAEAVASDGSLLLRHTDGTSTRIYAGDVTLRQLSG